MSGKLQAYRRPIRTICTAATIVGLAALLAACPNPVTRLVDTDVLVANAGGRPVVESRSPEPGATEVAGDSPIVVEFSMAMDPESLTPQAIEVSAGGMPLSGLVAYNEDTRTATFTPEVDLPRDSLVEVVVSDQVRNAGGAPLSAPIEWSFSTTLVNDYEIAVDVSPGEEPVSAQQPVYVAAVALADKTIDMDSRFSMVRLESLSSLTRVYVDLRVQQATHEYLVSVLHDRNNSVGSGADEAAYESDSSLVGQWPANAYNGLAMNFDDPADVHRFYTATAPGSAVTFSVLEQIERIDPSARNADAGLFGNPDVLVAPGSIIELSFPADPDAVEAVDAATELTVDAVADRVQVSKYGVHWFRFTPQDSTWNRLEVDRVDDDSRRVYARATIWDDNPIAGAPSMEHDFYSLNEAENDFGFWSSNVRVDWPDVAGTSFQAGTTYYVKLLVVLIDTGGPVAPPLNAITNIVFE